MLCLSKQIVGKYLWISHFIGYYQNLGGTGNEVYSNLP